MEVGRSKQKGDAFLETGDQANVFYTAVASSEKMGDESLVGSRRSTV